MMKAVLFDLDGTLLNRDASLEKFLGNQHSRLYQSLAHIPKETYISRFIELDCRGYVWKDKVYAQLSDEFSIKEITTEDLLLDYLDEFSEHCVPFPNLHSVLRQLKNRHFSLGMITNGYEKFQMDNIKALRIGSYFDTILVSESEGIKKPDTEIFHRALQRLQVSADESIYVGDHPENDVKAAERAGMKAVWKIDNYWGQVEAHYRIDNLLELEAILSEI
ncbi:HAD-IA family hydrolase [Bacillus sp. AGMB 02131]|uniref:HAD-IA family hydrolase n=1 Tax=Peribacillus faecalis TaxID=2772559 RepID=A0A927HAX9_9BACI|nr:HAD-IA family hydrolase [Peribacillus faecalis]MBD3109175.1 HAD-IA family hydrolase [Peribacillus faecalis]